MSKCDDKDIALKSFFLGPQAENSQWLTESVHSILTRWFLWRKELYPQDGKVISSDDQKSKRFIANQKNLDRYLHELVSRLEDEVPQFSPRYIGHMFSEISLPALLGHIITLLHNPNSISSESARISIYLEKEAIQMLMAMVGYNPKKGAGHFTSGGTVANFEAMYRAKKRLELWLKTTPKLSSKKVFEQSLSGWEESKNNYNSVQETSQRKTRFEKFYRQYINPVILVPASYHYSWPKGASLMGLATDALWPIELDDIGRMCTKDLEKKLEKAYKEQRPVLMMVSVVGSTELGSFDNVQEINKILGKWKKRGVYIWHHIDAAYGGFFASMRHMKKSCSLSSESLQALNALHESTSMTIDPHKLGYVPYSSGTFMAQNKLDYYLTSQNPPYIQFDFTVDPGPFTLEGSRSATGAIATWLSGKSVGFNESGYGRILDITIQARKIFETRLKKIKGIQIVPGSESNIVCFTIAKKSQSLKQSNEKTNSYIQNIFHRNHFYVSKTTIYFDKYQQLTKKFISQWTPNCDDDKIVCVRLCLMNPFLISKESKTNFIEEFCQDLQDQID